MKRDRWIALTFLMLSGGALLMIFIINSSSGMPEEKNSKILYSESDPLDLSWSEPIPEPVNQLFAKPSNPVVDVPVPADTASWESRFYGVALKGTAGSEMAVIRGLDDGVERIVKPGDTVGNGRVAAIGRNFLELDGPSGREMLRLPTGDRAGSKPGDASRSTGGSSRSNSDGDYVAAGDRATGKAVMPGSGDLQIVERQLLRDLVTQVDALSREITLAPVRHADGTPAGFRITAIRPRGLLARMGLRRGDTLLAVNAQKIQTLEDAYRTLESTFHQNTLALTILRNQQNMELTYVIR